MIGLASSSTYVPTALERVERLFPLRKEVGLKIFGVLSAHRSIADKVNENTCMLNLIGAYTLEDALAVNAHMVNLKIGTIDLHVLAALVTSVAYEQLVPPDKLVEMIDVIDKEARKALPEPQERNVDQMIAYARYVFGQADATPFEKGILTAVIQRFRTNMLPKPAEVLGEKL